MKKKVILPFPDQPLSIMYHHMAFSLGMIQANTGQDITPWLCRKYVNCFFRIPQSICQFEVGVYDSWCTAENILLRQRLDLTRDAYSFLHIDIVCLFRHMLNQNQYVHGFYNEEFIPGKFFYQRAYFRHNFLLIGYDDIKKVFHSVGYLADRHFHRFEIPYDNMHQAIFSLKDEKLAFNFWSYNTDTDFTLDLPKVVNELTDYIHSTTSRNQYKGEKIYGLAAIEKLAELFLHQAEAGKQVDPRYTKGLLEHKLIIKKCMDYLKQQGCELDQSVLSNANTVCEMANKIHHLGLKHSVTGNIQYVVSVGKIVEEMNKLESCYLPNVIKVLQEKSKAQGGFIL